MEILFCVVLALVLVGSLVWHGSRSQNVLQEWARQNGYRLVKAKMAYFFRGPFFWTTSKGQSV
jgi:hypothetical protein